MEFITHTLSNGIRAVHLPVKGSVAHLGIIINAGSKNEKPEEHGIAHLTEHMLFKGTKSRKSYHILSRLDDVGGELNAYTTKEETAIHASVLTEHFERALELIKDIVFNSVFPPKEIEKEKEVIIEEINAYRDNPAELIFDDFEEIIFKDQPIGRNILGTPETVKSFTRENILSFVRRNYSTSGMVISSVANIESKKVISLINKHFQPVPANTGEELPLLQPDYHPTYTVRELDTWQNHCIIGNISYNIHDRKRTGMVILNNILGGQGLNSRLNISLREKNGLAYNVESVYNPYNETGLFSIYFGTDPGHIEKSMTIAYREMKKLRTRKLGILQLTRAKNQIKGYVARGFESYESLMLSMGKNILVFNRIDTPEDIYKKIDAVTASELMDIANEVLDEQKLSVLIYK
ncbi:MAG: pitrilysin family protein [Bacteroidales bacterium]